MPTRDLPTKPTIKQPLVIPLISCINFSKIEPLSTIFHVLNDAVRIGAKNGDKFQIVLACDVIPPSLF